MAKSKYEIKSATENVLSALDAMANMFARGVKMSTRKLAAGARREARRTLQTSAEGKVLPQKHAKILPREIGIDYTDGGATIYAPVTNTEEMRNQMYWTEYGTGQHTKNWAYYTTENDKNPKVVQDSKGRLIGLTKKSAPVGYMKAARRYLITNANKEVANDIKIMLAALPKKYYKKGLHNFASSHQGSYLETAKDYQSFMKQREELLKRKE